MNGRFAPLMVLGFRFAEAGPGRGHGDGGWVNAVGMVRVISREEKRIFGKFRFFSEPKRGSFVVIVSGAVGRAAIPGG